MNTAKPIAWYFDFISPFAYLQHEHLSRLPSGTRIEYKPVLLAALLNHWDGKGPAEIVPKRQWTYEHCLWLAHRHGIPMTMPPEHPFNPLPLLRLSIALGNTPEVVRRLFHWVWREGNTPADAAGFQALLQELHATPDMLDAAEVKQQLRGIGEQAIAANVFGVPTAVVDNRVFWGFDSTDMLLACLAGDPFFQSPSYLQAADRPVGVQRRT
ncbi:2-hydroxychromene-2-carboxylate isomerase [Noviherbaspirillum aerium]|uniref:2-hydroxychromene-2-carboxylate isomerase n=1 Tax=Noviherbaspirillum aerium TaxID=2588497 RepID=UPI00124BE548|nr:2-hydroxychromene-2-carboxylate isomerase [Noviherbaspirillum aerium]